MEITEFTPGESVAPSKNKKETQAERKIFVLHRMRKKKIAESELIIHDDTGYAAHGADQKEGILLLRLFVPQPNRRNEFFLLIYFSSFFALFKSTKEILKGKMFVGGKGQRTSFFFIVISFASILRPHNLCSLNINTPRQKERTRLPIEL